MASLGTAPGLFSSTDSKVPVGATTSTCPHLPYASCTSSFSSRAALGSSRTAAAPLATSRKCTYASAGRPAASSATARLLTQLSVRAIAHASTYFSRDCSKSPLPYSAFASPMRFFASIKTRARAGAPNRFRCAEACFPQITCSRQRSAVTPRVQGEAIGYVSNPEDGHQCSSDADGSWLSCACGSGHRVAATPNAAAARRCRG